MRSTPRRAVRLIVPPAALAVLLLAGCAQTAVPPPTPSAPGWTAELTVTATGATTAEVAVQVLGSPVHAVTAKQVPVPWTDRVTTAVGVEGGTASWTVSVAPADDHATVTCRIRIDGATVVEQRSSAAGRGVVCRAERPA